VRFDKETVPAFKPGASSISFGFGDKIAPRLGFAYDALHNGKLKFYGSYGKFFDIMKFSLARGSFGGDYWHDCTYALDNPDYTTITPTAPGNHGCPATGAAPGVGVGRFIENIDFRADITNPNDPGVQPGIKPMQQHEFVTGAEWAISPKLAFEARYSRKRLDETIEDIGWSDNFGFYIGNPGSAYSDLLKRPLPAAGVTSAICPSCPKQPKAIRNYDGLEFRLTKQGSAHWFGTMSYTYSRLYGNYSGLTDTDVTDGNGGRHNPNNHRSFDAPQMQFDSHGKVIDGPLATDRPHTLKLFGYYNLKWFGGETMLGTGQYIMSGTPVATCWPTGVSQSSCQYVEGRDGWVDLHRDAATGNLVVDRVRHGVRTAPYLQTDLNLQHQFRVSKTNERLRLVFEANAQNLLNQRSELSRIPIPLQSGAVAPTTTAANNPSGLDFQSMETGWNYVGITNASNKILYNRYGMPNMWQNARQIRLKIAFTF
jgi:hypothetical protein